ncbi:MAG: tetratricopeptide repeat protein [bacterium]|nr:hypothetical protein [bacterium]MBU1916591.1 hypothetical protein [bacterium]
MSRTCQFIVIFLCITLTVSACDFFVEKEVVKKRKVEAVRPKVSTVVTSPVVPSNKITCLENIKSNKAITIKQTISPHVLTIEVDSNKIVDEATLVQWLSQFAQTLFDQESCSLTKIYFSTHLDVFSYFQGVLKKNDYSFYKQRRISEAEWVKRFEIKKMETKEALNIELKKMRELKDLGSALKIVTRILNDDINNQDVKLVKANILLDMRSYSDALNTYEDVLASQPDNIRALFNSAFVSKEMGSFAQAIEKTKKVRDLLADKEKGSKYLAQLGLSLDTVLLQLAEVYLKNNETALAVATLKDIKNKSAAAYVLLKAQLHRLTQKYEEAKNELMTVVDSGDWQDVILFNMVLLHLDLKDKGGAKQYFEMLSDVNKKMAQELSLVNNLPTIQEEAELPSEIEGGEQ